VTKKLPLGRSKFVLNLDIFGFSNFRITSGHVKNVIRTLLGIFYQRKFDELFNRFFKFAI